MNLTNYHGETCDIEPYLKIYQEGDYSQVFEWMWSELYHQGNIGTAAVAWILKAHTIYLESDSPDWNFPGFVYSVMHSLEELKHIPCPDWAEGKIKPVAIKTLQHALNHLSDPITEEQQTTILALTSAIAGTYASYELIQYAWGGYEEQLMEMDLD